MSRTSERSPRIVSDRALEMIMREVLDGMMELSLEMAFSGDGAVFQILDTGSHEKRSTPIPDSHDRQSAEVIDFPQLRQVAC